MKNVLFGTFAALLLLTSCEKNNGGDPKPPDAVSYNNKTEGSMWLYHQSSDNNGTTDQSDYTITSTGRDTTINNKSYHIYDRSFGGNQYLAVSGSNYFQYDSLPAGLGDVIERLYLKVNAPKGATWSQDVSVEVPVGGIPFNVTVTINNKIEDTGLTRTVGGNDYTDVIHVSTVLSLKGAVPGATLTSDIHTYYAPDYGMIENSTAVAVSFLGVQQSVNSTTTLKSATLK